MYPKLSTERERTIYTTSSGVDHTARIVVASDEVTTVGASTITAGFPWKVASPPDPTTMKIPVTKPPKPEAGNIFYDIPTGITYIYDGSTWKPLGSVHPSLMLDPDRPMDVNLD